MAQIQNRPMKEYINTYVDKQEEKIKELDRLIKVKVLVIEKAFKER